MYEIYEYRHVTCKMVITIIKKSILYYIEMKVRDVVIPRSGLTNVPSEQSS